MSVISQIKKGLNKLDGDLVLVLTSAKNYTHANTQILKFLTGTKKMVGVYVTVNKPYKTIKKVLDSDGVKTNSLIFIDAISHYTKNEIKKIDNCLFLGSPEDLTGISLAITEAIQALPPNHRFLFFDSLSTLAIHNSSGSVAKFAHFLTSKLREWDVTGIMISLESEADKRLINQLAQFCDLTLNLGGKK